MVRRRIKEYFEKTKHRSDSVKTATTKKQVRAKRLAILIIFSIVFSVYAIVNANEKKKRRAEKVDFVNQMYESMAQKPGYTLRYSLDTVYNVNHKKVELHYSTIEEVDKAGKKKKMTMRTYGDYMGTEMDMLQIYYYQDTKCILETVYTDDNGEEQHKYKVTTEDISYDYNPMLALALVVTEQPGEFAKAKTTIRGSVSLKDVDTFLTLSPYGNLYNGMENLSCYKEQANNLMITSDGNVFREAVLDMTVTSFYMLKDAYEEQGLPVSIDSYRISVSAESWDTPVIEIPEIEVKEESK